MRTFVRISSWVLGFLVILAGAVAWWFIYRPLPQLDGSISLHGLQHEVTVDRDGWGVPYIRAASVEDAAEAQGYVMAQDRLWQLDLLRRVARGQLSEILGARTLQIDKDFRTLGLGRIADREATTLEKRVMYRASLGKPLGAGKAISGAVKNADAHVRIFQRSVTRGCVRFSHSATSSIV